MSMKTKYRRHGVSHCLNLLRISTDNRLSRNHLSCALFQDQVRFTEHYSVAIQCRANKTWKTEHKTEVKTFIWLIPTPNKGPKSLFSTTPTPLLVNSGGRRCRSLCGVDGKGSGRLSISPSRGSLLVAERWSQVEGGGCLFKSFPA